METKVCKSCNCEKLLSEFRVHHKECRRCAADKNKIYRKLKKESETPEEHEARIIKQREYYHARMSDPTIKARIKQREYINVVKNPINSLYNRAKARAKMKGLDFNITKEDILIPDKCPVFGIELIPNSRKGSETMDNSPSLDRIDSSKGYIKGNIMVISLRANLLKNNATPEEIELLYNFYCTPKSTANI